MRCPQSISGGIEYNTYSYHESRVITVSISVESCKEIGLSSYTGGKDHNIKCADNPKVEAASA